MVVVSLRWNGEPLATRTGRSGETVGLGEGRDAMAALPEEALGCASLIIADAQGGAHVRVPAGKVASITGGAGGGLRLVAGPARLALAAGEEAQLVLGAFDVVIAASVVEAAPRRRRLAAGAWLHTAVVAAIHAALLVASSHTALAGQMEAESEPDLGLLRGYLASAEERSSTPDAVSSDGRGRADGIRANGRNGNGRDGGGARHGGEPGKAGASTSRASNRRFAAPAQPEKGSAASPASELEAARDFGLAGLLRSPTAGFAAATAGVTPWGAGDPFAASGGLLGRVAGESSGVGGLGLSGTGEGGGGRGEGIGLGSIGTIGHSDGLPGIGTGGAGTTMTGVGGFGWGGSWDSIGRHRVKPPVVRWGGDWSMVTGRLPAQAIQRVVRANFGRFRACYELGLRKNPQLAGRVSTSFVIGRDGSVMSAAEGGSDLPDKDVPTCVRRAFAALSFPQPEGGVVHVTYPLTFSSPDQL